MNLSKTRVILNVKSVIILINEQPNFTIYTGVLQLRQSALNAINIKFN